MATTDRYALPDCLRRRCTSDAYRRWLQRKATAHARRDRKRGNSAASISTYKQAIHAAVLHGGDRDAYTGKPLRWDLISKYENAASEAGGRKYKRRFANLPSVDHVGDGTGRPWFRICSWRTNDSKSDLSYDEFVKLCKDVVTHERRYRARTRGRKTR